MSQTVRSKSQGIAAARSRTRNPAKPHRRVPGARARARDDSRSHSGGAWGRKPGRRPENLACWGATAPGSILVPPSVGLAEDPKTPVQRRPIGAGVHQCHPRRLDPARTYRAWPGRGTRRGVPPGGGEGLAPVGKVQEPGKETPLRGNEGSAPLRQDLKERCPMRPRERRDPEECTGRSYRGHTPFDKRRWHPGAAFDRSRLVARGVQNAPQSRRNQRRR